MRSSYKLSNESVVAEFIGTDDLVIALDQIIPSHEKESLAEPSVSVRKNTASGKFELSGSGLHQPFTCEDPVNAVCGITSGLIGRYAQRVNDKLCFHAAAVIFKGKAFLIPSTYKSGKSAFCLAWLQSGEDILTDDATIVEPSSLQVQSFGLPLCIRNSLLKSASHAKRTFVDNNTILSGKHLTYIKHSNMHTDRHYPFGGWIFLSRQHDGDVSIRSVAPGSVLQQIIWQNFARNMLPSVISKYGSELATKFPILSLSYSEADDVIPMLKDALAINPDSTKIEAPAVTFKTEFSQSDHVSVLMTEAGGIVSDDRKGRVYSFNHVALQFWYLMTSNTDPEDAATILGELYPQMSIEIVLKDFNAFKTKLIDLDLLQTHMFVDDPNSAV